MRLFNYISKVLKNVDNVYEYENRTLREAGIFLLVFFACIGMIVFPFCKIILKWLAYFSIGSFAFFMFGAFVNSINEILKSFRYAKRLEKIGTSVEEEEMARRALCEKEGDDGLSPAEINKF